MNQTVRNEMLVQKRRKGKNGGNSKGPSSQKIQEDENSFHNETRQNDPKKNRLAKPTVGLQLSGVAGNSRTHT